MMASVACQIARSLQKSVVLSTQSLLVRSCPATIIAHRKYARKIPEYFERFKVEPRQPIEDLVSHNLIYRDVDPAPFFLDSRTQEILKNLTGRDISRVFKHRKTKRIEPPRYEFLTEDQLQLAYEKANLAASNVLHMVPVMKIREDSEEIIRKDPELKGYHDTKLVITDISAGIPDSKRLILVREPDGTLKHANMEQRHRMNCIYNPREGRSIHMPQLFSMKKLMAVLKQREYEFVLDRACLQMEPYEAAFQAVQAVTFEAVDSERDYDVLLSTRHYGPMVFFLSWHKKLDGLLEHLLKDERMSEVQQVLSLFSILHPQSAVATAGQVSAEQLVKIYIKEESSQSASLELCLQVYLDSLREREASEQGSA